ncbi:hypothetical protein U1Q18_052100 [Sarracenia purpurea var. burkii]
MQDPGCSIEQHQNGSATAVGLLHKLCKRASSLLSSTAAPVHGSLAPPALVLSRSLGFSLALALVQQVGWPVLSYESTAATFITAGFQALQSYAALAPVPNAPSAQARISNEVEEQILRDAILLVGEEILRAGSSGGRGLVQGGDFMRTVLTPNVPKYANFLVGALQGAVAQGELRAQVILLQALSSELNFGQRSTGLQRANPRKLHAMLFSPTLSPYSLPPLEVVQSASRLLIDLHRTGAISSKAHLQGANDSAGANNAGLGFVYEAAAGSAGNTRASQAQLWRATIDQALGTFELFATSCVSSILPTPQNAELEKRRSPHRLEPADLSDTL